MGLSVSEFWRLTFREFWELHEAQFGKRKKPITANEVRNLEKAWINGNTRRVSSTTDSRDKSA